MHELLKLAKRKKDKEDNGPGMGTAGALGGAAVGGFVGAKQLRDESRGTLRHVTGFGHPNKAFKFTGALRGGSAGLIGSTIGSTDENGNTNNTLNVLKGTIAGAVAAPYLEAGINQGISGINRVKKSMLANSAKKERNQFASSLKQERAAKRKAYNAGLDDIAAHDKVNGKLGPLNKAQNAGRAINNAEYHAGAPETLGKIKALKQTHRAAMNASVAPQRIGGWHGFGRGAAIGGIGALGYSMYKNKKNKKNKENQ